MANRGRKAARRMKLEAYSAPDRPVVARREGCFFCHVAIGHWHEDDCLYRGKVTEDHA